MRRKVSSYLALSRTERTEFRSALWRLVIIRISLIGGIKRTERWFGPTIESQPIGNNHELIRTWQRRAKAIQRASQLVPEARCLARSLTLRWWLRQHELPGRIIIGVRRSHSGLETHSWIQLGAAILDDRKSNIETFQIIREEAPPAGPPA